MTTQTNQSEQEKVNAIRQVIRESGDRWRARFPILGNNDLMGLLIFTASILGIGASAYGYLSGAIGALTCIVIVAFLTSLLHELEHDLIHWQYFKKNKVVHNFMMFGVWFFRPGTINPWIRRHLHFLHHKTSGTDKDIEERGIGNGQAYSPLRWWIMFDPVVGNIAKILIEPESRKAFRIARLFAAYFPFGVVTILCWYAFLGFHLVNGITHLAGSDFVWSEVTLHYMGYVDKAVVLLIAPHYLRSFCLIFISSSMHYYGNVDSMIKQTQVLNAWYFWPFQLFCFNFGSTHGIHHFVVGEPFYIRQLTENDAHKAMRENGVPFNDLGTFKRSNRFPQT
ncbi:MAG: fatty acid desaturase [Pseudomonadales bacterium]|nr:fatty acid desaturase [Pseudomonadales bacterium]